jgi:hypothetical protein
MHSPKLSALAAAGALISEAGRNWARNVREFCLSVSLSYLKGSLTCYKILRHGTDSFTSSPKEVVLWIFIALKNPSFSAGFEPANPGFNNNHNK